jgi:hypothetical protein
MNTTQNNGQNMGSQLAMGQSLLSGQFLQSPLGAFSILMTTNGFLVETEPNGTIDWSSSGPHLTGNYFAMMQTDSNFCIYRGTPDNNQGLVWQTATAGHTGNIYASIDDSGDFAIIQNVGGQINFLWESGAIR